MTAGIVGLGLIGGSFAKAYHAAGEKVLAFNRSRDTLDFAMLSGAVDGELTKDNIGECDIVIIAVFPEAAASFLEQMAPYIGKKPIVIDACGTKRKVCELCFPIAEKYGFTYIGGHPMAGTQYSGFKHARANLYHGAPMVLVPPTFDDIELLEKAEKLLSPVGFGKYSVTTAEKHDGMIAFTSQMPHIISNAYIKSPTAGTHKGFSAGSYKDLTRVAWLNPNLWAELFMENKDNVLNELNLYIDSLQKYRDAIENDDTDELVALLYEGKKRKEEVDGR
ncbi:MAG: prephenate dehydrogenase [Bacillota bacterium]|nr:prephenate dehydrogenase [Bacillota bacterium]